MGREVRMVPADWQHPKYTKDSAPHENWVGNYIPLLDGDYQATANDWDEGRAKWEAGFVEDYATSGWKPKDGQHTGRYTEWAGERPSPDDYMPNWSDAQRTHLMMYEDTSEGTPISPAFLTPEELAHWLADNGASSFGSNTATHDQWLATCRAGWAVSAVWSAQTGLVSGVEAGAS